MDCKRNKDVLGGQGKPVRLSSSQIAEIQPIVQAAFDLGVHIGKEKALELEKLAIPEKI